MPDNERLILHRVAWRIVPFLCCGYVLNALDRYNVSVAALTMNRDLGLSASAYGLGAGAYFWSYVLCQLPANLVLRALGARLWLSLIMALWGVISAGTALVTDQHTFVVARFLLGIAEAGYFPGVAYFLTCWFPNRHRGRMMGLFFAASAVASVVGAPLSANLLRLDTVLGLAGWQWVFLAEGLPAVLLAGFGFATLRNRPADAPWLRAVEKTWLQQQLAAESAQKPSHGKGLAASVANGQIVLLIMAFMCTLYGVYCVSFFLPLMVKGMGLTNTATGYVTAVPNLCSAIGMVLLSRSSDRTGERFWHVLAPVTCGALGTIAAAFLLGNVYWAMAAFCVALAGLSSTLPLFWNLPTAYFGAATAAAGIGVINTFGNMSGYFAPQFTGLLHDATGAYVAPLLAAGALGLIAPALIILSGIRRYLPNPSTQPG